MEAIKTPGESPEAHLETELPLPAIECAEYVLCAIPEARRQARRRRLLRLATTAGLVAVAVTSVTGAIVGASVGLAHAFGRGRR